MIEKNAKIGKIMIDGKEPNKKLKLEQKIEEEDKKIRQLNARKQAAEARAYTLKKDQSRKDDTRTKILLGSYLKKKMESDPVFNHQILDELETFLTSDRDRALFGLSPLDY